jgi:hypothetical protein
MTQAWFIPVGALVGMSSTQTALKTLKSNPKDRSWWLLLVLGWVPLLCWVLSQFVVQD